MRSVNRTPMSPARALSVVPPPTPKAARMPPTTALTMPLRIRLAPSAASQPRTMLVQLVPSSASRSSRTSPALRGADSSLLSDTLVHLHTENQSLGSRTRHQISNFTRRLSLDRRYALPVTPLGILVHGHLLAAHVFLGGITTLILPRFCIACRPDRTPERWEGRRQVDANLSPRHSRSVRLQADAFLVRGDER